MTDKLDFTKRKSFKKKKQTESCKASLKKLHWKKKKVKLKSTEENHSDIIMKNGGREKAAQKKIS